jgi:hypothetical protein
VIRLKSIISVTLILVLFLFHGEMMQVARDVKGVAVAVATAAVKDAAVTVVVTATVTATVTVEAVVDHVLAVHADRRV